MKSGAAKYFLFFFGVLIVVLGYRYYDYKVRRDYTLEVNTACDPAEESCFIADGPDYEDVYNSEPYKKVTINAGYAPLCLEEHACEAFSCAGIAGECVVTYCDETIESEGEVCVPRETSTSIEP